MALTITGKNYTQISSCDSDAAGGSWADIDTQDLELYKEGSASLCGILNADGESGTFTPTSSVDLSGNCHLRFWFLGAHGSALKTKAAGGIQFFATDGVNTGYWYVGGIDTYPGGWVNMVVNLANDVDAGTKPTAMDTITEMGIQIGLTTSTKNALNTWVDNLCVCDGLIAYGDINSGAITCSVVASAGTFTRSAGSFLTDGFRIGQTIDTSGFTNGGNNTTKIISTVTDLVITVTDTTGLVNETGDGDEVVSGYFDFSDIFSVDDSSLGIGIIRNIGGIYFSTGSLEFGDVLGIDVCKFQAKSQVLIFENRDINLTLYNITVVDESTATTEFILGSKAGTAGIEGCVIRVEDITQTPKFDILGNNANVDNFKLYGSTFLDAGSIEFPPTATNVEILNCNFESCGEILPNTAIVKFCNVISANDRGLRISTASHNVTDSSFINCPHCVHVNLSTTIAFDNLTFTGSDGSTKYDIEHSVSGALIVNATNGSNPNSSYVHETGGGSTTINNAVNITITVFDQSNDPIQDAQVAVYKSSDNTQLMNEDTLVTGIATESFNFSTDTDIYVRVRKSSSGTTRYEIFSTTGKITSAGFTLTVTLKEDDIAST